MADFTDGFWSPFIAILTILGMLGCGLLLWMQATTKVKLEPGKDPSDNTTGHTWDEDLGELNNPLPRCRAGGCGCFT